MQEKALEYAEKAHLGQKRKYINEDYIEHPKRVAESVKSIPHSEEMICAAYLHDVVEDTSFTVMDIKQSFGEEVAQLVHELTDQYIKQDYPHLNRKARKKLETKRQRKISPEAKTIKLADVIDNTRDIVKNDPNFARKYLREMESLVESLQGGNFQLLMLACYEIQKGKIDLNIS